MTTINNTIDLNNNAQWRTILESVPVNSLLAFYKFASYWNCFCELLLFIFGFMYLNGKIKKESLESYLRNPYNYLNFSVRGALFAEN